MSTITNNNIFPKRPWLLSDTDINNKVNKVLHNTNTITNTTTKTNNNNNDMKWKACDWGGLPLHWCEENDLPPIENRPLILQVDDDICMDYDNIEDCIAWNSDLTLGHAKETTEVLKSLKKAQNIKTHYDYNNNQNHSIMSPFIKEPHQLDSQLSPKPTIDLNTRKWGSYIFLFFLLVSVITYLIILSLGDEVKFLPGYIYFEKYTPIVYATGVFSLGLFAQFIL